MTAADQINQRLQELRDAHPTPRWIVVTFAKSGSIYDCLWNSLRQSQPPLLSPQQQAALNTLNRIAQQLAAANQPTATMRAHMVNVIQGAAPMWFERRDTYLTRIAINMVNAYVNAALLARRYGLGEFALSRARKRLRIVATELGDEKMARIVNAMRDPTDPQPNPDVRRPLIYVVGAFDDFP